MIHSLTNEKIEEEFSSDHAGIVETSAMMELYPDTVHMDKHIQSDWFAERAVHASAEFGSRYVSAIVDNMEKLLF
jgi:creatinine amidohydrolase/Fe(II)-dependent formamide hydrolase-like protein